jgi:hypothetical protein
MNLFITIILLMKCVYLFGEKIYKQQLRGMYEEELSRILLEEFTSTIDSIQDKIIERAKTGVNEYKFTIMCSNSKQVVSIPNCENHDGHKEWIRNHPNSILSISKTYTTREEITRSLIDALQNIFPDTNITKSYKNCCDHYQIEW